MSTEYTAVTTIVVLAALRQQAEAAAIAADPEGGAGTFIPGTWLRQAGDPTNTPFAYIARWNMKPGQRSAFASAIGGPINILAPGAAVPTNRDRWLFDSSGPTGWTTPQVMAALNLADPIPPVMG